MVGNLSETSSLPIPEISLRVFLQTLIRNLHFFSRWVMLNCLSPLTRKNFVGNLLLLALQWPRTNFIFGIRSSLSICKLNQDSLSLKCRWNWKFSLFVFI